MQMKGLLPTTHGGKCHRCTFLFAKHCVTKFDYMPRTTQVHQTGTFTDVTLGTCQVCGLTGLRLSLDRYGQLTWIHRSPD